jgi:hypothetical protein
MQIHVSKILMYQVKKCLLVLLFILITKTLVYGHGEAWFKWTTISTFGLFDTKNEKILQSFDINSSWTFINGGLSYKNAMYMQSKNISNLSAYVGFGIGSIIQLQAGFSAGGFSLKNCYNVQIGNIFEKIANKHPYLGLITVSLSIEKYINKPQKNWYFGLGIGFSINNVYGVP